MNGDEADTYGERWADVYDDAPHVMRLAPVGLVADVLADLAGDGPALELGIGTGRVALPLADRGVDVHGIDASDAMVAKMREKPGGDAIPVTIGDLADVDVEGRFSLVFAVFNTLFALTSQEDQIRCFRNVADHLDERGQFLVEAFIPDLDRFDDEQTVRVMHIEDDEVHLETTQLDRVNQRIATRSVRLRDGEHADVRPIHLRYAWPSELDLMARLAGLRLRNRWSGWSRTPVTAASTVHISVYEREDRR